MALSWGTIKSLLLFFGPILLPKAIAQYRALRAAPQTQGLSIQPIPPAVRRALALFFITAVFFFIQTLPYFAPENIFTLTTSRLQIPTDVLFTRLSTLRKPPGLTSTDNILRTKINSLDSRLLYLQHGPYTITDCAFCAPESPNSYLYYSLPSLLFPHLLNLSIIGICTSARFTGRYGSSWRTTANIGAVGLALLDIYNVASYAHKTNSLATRLEDIDFFHWKTRIYRLLALALFDALSGWILYLSSTNRAFLNPPSTAERIETATRLVEQTRGKMSAIGILQNTVKRDAELRGKSEGYWVHEGKVTRELMEDKEVVDGVTNALENRIDMATIMRDAETYSQNLLRPFQAG